MALLLQTLSDDALQAYNGFQCQTPVNERTIKKILEKLDEFAIGEVDETYKKVCVQFNAAEGGGELSSLSLCC